VVTNRAGLLGLTAGSTTTSSTGVGTGSHSKTRSSPTTLAEADASAHGQSGGEPLLPIIVVAVLVLLLGGVSWFRWRRRPAEE
jgi:cobalamin biosynthesis Mg chelatase CobN